MIRSLLSAISDFLLTTNVARSYFDQRFPGILVVIKNQFVAENLTLIRGKVKLISQKVMKT